MLSGPEAPDEPKTTRKPECRRRWPTPELAGVERPSELLADGGVRLRRWFRGDGDEALRVTTEALDHLAPWMAWAADGYGRPEALKFIERSQADWDSGAAYNYAILAEDGAAIGCCSLMARTGGFEIGYWLHPGHTGRGIATRAARALVGEAFRLGAGQVEIVHDAANHASAAVPRRLGFTEVERRCPQQEPQAGAEVGVDVVWRRLAGPAAAG
ncbi:RimJ/RimL family protein N-acetyltransferase [Saccharopolyspora erythraea NRRL 2338]|nr:RimJ/RimL family protein N-acetyltransferase [Saccharopolyspora erythraea NRRL 2338]